MKIRFIILIFSVIALMTFGAQASYAGGEPIGCQDTGCPSELFCNFDTGICVECLSEADCDDGLFCNGAEFCITAGECVSDLGPCEPFSGGYCVLNVTCDEDADECILETDDSLCAEGEFCNNSGECEAIPPCTSDADCDDGLFCNAGICVAVPGPQFTVCRAPGLAIPDNDCVGIADTITTAGGCTIADVDVDLQIVHTYVGDLNVSLSHGGETALLVGRPGLTGADCPGCCGCSSDDIDVTVNDEGGDLAIENQCSDLPAITGNAQGGDPSGAVLSAFDGQSSAGDWILTVSDGASGDLGTLVEWCVIVTCVVEECTYTFGYWKTHSEYGPASYDDTWAQLANGADTPFFQSGLTYYEVLQTPPSGGNAYYILTHQYIAAELNFLKGADPSAAQAAFDEATDLFNTYTSDEIAAAKGKNGRELRNQFTSLAAILDEYNNGYIGPGHCVEETYEACCLPDGTCADLAPGECEAQGGNSHGPGTDCANVNCPTPPAPEACCLPNGGCAEAPPEECIIQGGQPQGLDSNCAIVQCPQLNFGACCLPGGGCIEGPLDLCTDQGGQPYDPGSTCFIVDCPALPEPEACCLPNGDCAEAPPEECIIQGGSPQGPDSFCDPSACPVPIQACCLPAGICIDMPTQDCVTQGGEAFPGDCFDVQCFEPPELEACCLATGDCFEGTPEGCISQNGQPQGPNSTCGAADCPRPLEFGACCLLVNGLDIQFVEVCSEVPEDQCTPGQWRGPGTTCDIPFICDPI